MSLYVDEFQHFATSDFADLFISDGKYDDPRVTDPMHRLDSLLYEVMYERNPTLPIPPEIVEGFYNQAKGMSYLDPRLQPGFSFPAHLVLNGQWTRRPEGGNEQLLHFIFHLRLVMQRLAENPIGKATAPSPADTAKMLTSLPKRAAFIRSADTVGVIYIHDTIPTPPEQVLSKQALHVLLQTRAVYCHPREQVERWFPPAILQIVPDLTGTRWEEIE